MAAKKYAYVNHEMLVWARSTTPFETTKDVQEKTNIAASKIDAWETGEEYPSITEAKKLANLYKLPFPPSSCLLCQKKNRDLIRIEEQEREQYIVKPAMSFGLKLEGLLETEKK